MRCCIAAASDFRYLDIVDRTDPPFDLEQIQDESTTRGAFVRMLQQQLAQSAESERAAFQNALLSWPARLCRAGDQKAMRITGIDIAAFGSLSNFSEEIAPGLHIFHGPNESGKSTLQQAVLALLYGFYTSDRAKAGENAARQRYTPWLDQRYAARLEYELQDGRRYRVDPGVRERRRPDEALGPRQRP